MFLKRLIHKHTGQKVIAVKQNGNWIPLMPLHAYARALEHKCTLKDEQLSDMVLLLSNWQLAIKEIAKLLEYSVQVPVNANQYQHGQLPFEPLSYRDFMLYEQHVINAGRGFIREILPSQVYHIMNIYEKVSRKPFSKVKPKKLWYQKPVYYMGNHLSILPAGSEVTWPSYSKFIDYELELGMLITRPLFNATAQEAKDAIGGFVIFNDCSARDKQLAEMDSGFGPVKSKNFASVLGEVVATPDEIWPYLQSMEGKVFINGVLSGSGRLAESRYPFEEAVAYASLGERIYPGEFMASGTIPGCSGIESDRRVNHGDEILMEIDRLGSLQTRIAIRVQEETK